MITNYKKIVNIIGLTALLAVAAHAAVVMCAGAYSSGTRVVRTCEGSLCDGDPNKGTQFDQDCTVWCCPSDWSQTSHYDSSSCRNKRRVGCCPVNSGAVTPGWKCPPPPVVSDPPSEV